MSDLEKTVRDACADDTVDMVTLIRSPGGGWQASVKRAYRGWSVHHDTDSVTALLATLTAPPLAPIKAPSPAPAASPAPAVDEDLFG